MSEALLRIRRITLTGLYGLYNHRVFLNSDERVTIIHGPNGVGKTTLLRLVNSFVVGRYLSIVKVPFEVFEIELDNGAAFGIRRLKVPDGNFDFAEPAESEEDPVAPKKGIKFEFFGKEPGEQEKTHSISAERFDISRLIRQIDNEFGWITRVGKDQWIDRRTDEVYSSEELVTTFADQLPNQAKRKLLTEPDWIKTIRGGVKTHLIETQRLLRIGPTKAQHDWRYGSSSDTVITTVRNHAADLQKRIADALAGYAKTSQSLDQSFPQRLLSGAMTPLNVEDLKMQMEDLEDKRGDLKRIGLLDEDTNYPFDVTKLESLNPTQNAVMTLYVEDTRKKLGVLNELAQRVNLLLNNVNRKFRHKSIDIDKLKGLVARDKNGNPLDLDALSSGEQHELVLIYDLLFRVVPNTLVLIDEPELSLHLNWQKAFLSDLLQIVEMANFDVLVATHSPFIAGDRHELMIPLSNELGEA